jgi:hypothetical protein
VRVRRGRATGRGTYEAARDHPDKDGGCENALSCIRELEVTSRHGERDGGLVLLRRRPTQLRVAPGTVNASTQDQGVGNKRNTTHSAVDDRRNDIDMSSIASDAFANPQSKSTNAWYLHASRRDA